jgi:hypothetical protein
MTSTTDIPTTPFYLRSFVATVPGFTTPVTEFSSGQDIQLSWESSGTAFTVYAAKDSAPLYSGADKTFIVKGGRTKATTFILVASVTGGPDSGVPYPDFETITLTDALTIEITNPTLTPASVTAGTLLVTGNSTLQSVTSTSAQVTGPLTVSAAATLSGGATVSGLTVDGTTTLSGGVRADSAAITGALTAGSSALGDASAASLSVANWVTMLNPKGIGAGSYTPSSDGLVVGTVGWPGNAGQKCSAVAYGWTARIGNVYATGGNDVMWTNGSTFWMWMVGGSFVLPVSRGAPFTIGVYQVNGADVAAPVSFAWVPFGTSAALAEASDEELAASGYSGLHVPMPATEPAPFDPDFAISEIIGVLGDAMDEPLDPGDSDRLTTALRDLVYHAIPHRAARG